ncbi:MAG: sulfatase-like hydrolase/transferase [Planctomycetota bacterium]|nr:sulfatase-like hydrolase/transferase [Planctomycetota bacterium]
MSEVSRRAFVAGVGAMAMGGSVGAAQEGGRPNVLWIVSEDNNPFLGCYGNRLVRTPNLDGLAREGFLYERCFSQAPVCAPSRFTLITGVYATSCGPAHHMRAAGKIPGWMRGFGAYLREAGYYCTNNAKTDYNGPIKMKDAWDESSKNAHWRNRPKGRPFFAVFNHEVTHESCLFPQNRGKYRAVKEPVDPAKVELPKYHPDTAEFRRDWADYLDQMSRLDEQVGKLLKQLEEDGLAEDTIVFYYGDNGGILPRSKRFCYDSGLRVPLIVRFGKKCEQLAPGAKGGRVEGPVSFVDFAPTVLSLAGVEVPKYMEGHAFLGKGAEMQRYAFGFRGRMDERYDMVRTVRDKGYRYVRNYLPHLIYGQHVQYMFNMRSMKAWEKLNQAGKLVGAQRIFWGEKPAEELYDLERDPSEVENLAGRVEYGEKLEEMRRANEEQILRTRDNGFVPEGSELEGYESARDDRAYPLKRIMEVANVATEREAGNVQRLVGWMGDENECVRYWAVMGCVMLRAKAGGAKAGLIGRLADESGAVRVAAAEGLCWIGEVEKGLSALSALLVKAKNPWTRLQAANAMQELGAMARPALSAIEQAQSDPTDYVKRAIGYTAAVLKGEAVKEAE